MGGLRRRASEGVGGGRERKYASREARRPAERLGRRRRGPLRGGSGGATRSYSFLRTTGPGGGGGGGGGRTLSAAEGERGKSGAKIARK